MCLLGPPNKRKIVLTGGYSDDDFVHVLDVHPSQTVSRNTQWAAFQPSGQLPSFVYGASLTPINDRSALRFGGFRAGGYSAETAECYLLTLERDEEDEVQARWERVAIRGHSPAARAYHTATLLNNRYLVVIGGMQSSGSILSEAVLDVHTWTWLPTNIVTDPLAAPKPSPRHGHSIALDSRRDRLVLFGGGSGSDLLRSGVDNSEVWELKMVRNWNTDFESSLPWQWSRLHRDAREEEDEAEDGVRAENRLSLAERLCLGRCHVGFSVSRDTVLLAFGSGRPSTNGVLAYNLRTDTFHRPRVHGPLPVPRFTAAAVVLDGDGWLVAHGGYGNGAIGDVVVLDLAPGMNRTFPALPTVEGDDEEEVTSHEPVRDADVAYGSDADSGEMLMELMTTHPDQRQLVATTMLHQLMATGRMGGREAFFLAMVANGNAVFHSGSSSDDEEVENEMDD